MEEKIKKWLLYFALIVLVLPLVQYSLPFIQSGGLKGSFKKVADVDFSIPTWMDGSYQHEKEQHLNDSTGFRPDLVRLTNQIDYSLFSKCHTIWTVKGKDDYLFQFPYIEAYYGLDYCGQPAILERCIKLKAIQDTLHRLGKSLILAYLPSKASFYPEYFPDNRVEQYMGITNHTTYRHIADSLGINQVDLEAWFISMKNKNTAPLFSKQGIHWTMYGAVLGGDSLIRYMEKLTGIPVQHPTWAQLEYTDKIRDGDDDIAQELNLIFPVAKETLAYPIIKDAPITSSRKINAIYIGDSYAHKMIEFGIVHKMNGQCEFWSYFNEMHDINGHKFTYINKYDWIGAIDKADCVVISYTQFNMYQLGNGFIEQAYDHYYPNLKVNIQP